MIIQDYCSIMSFQTEADALDTKVGHIQCCAGDALTCGERGEARMEELAGAWFARRRLQ